LLIIVDTKPMCSHAVEMSSPSLSAIIAHFSSSQWCHKTRLYFQRSQ